MPENLLHFIWQQKLFMRFEQFTTEGMKVEVIDTGRHNTDGGPDFFNAKIRIGEQIWVGNVEIHINSSDWYKHHHDSDTAYDNVILHVVLNADTQVRTTSGEIIPQCQLRFPQSVKEKYLQWLVSDKFAACHDDIKNIPNIYIEDWKTSLLADRLLKKSKAIHDILSLYHNNWEETFYIVMAHYFGFHTNGAPFEMTAKSLPLSYIGKHRDNLFQIEALLFGQAGMLADNGEHDTYYTELRHEYNFLQNKFQLTPIDGSMWKFLRMRPDNFPTVRIAQFAALLHKSDHLFATLLGASDIEELQQIIDVNASEYWDTHYKFDTPSIKRTKHLGINAINTIIINVVVPFLFAYGLEHDMPPYQERAEILLDNIPYEKNSIISNWKETGINVKSAADSQALIHLHEYYCTDKRCLHCRVAKALTLSSR